MTRSIFQADSEAGVVRVGDLDPHACNHVHLPAALLAVVAEESFLLVVARGVGVAFGTGGRLSAAPFSGV